MKHLLFAFSVFLALPAFAGWSNAEAGTGTEIAIDEAGTNNTVGYNFSAELDGGATGGSIDVDGSGSYKLPNYVLGGEVPDRITAVRSGAAPTECREVGQLFYDTDETDDTNCTTTADNVMCRCTAVGTPGTWVTTETD